MCIIQPRKQSIHMAVVLPDHPSLLPEAQTNILQTIRLVGFIPSMPKTVVVGFIPSMPQTIIFLQSQAINEMIDCGHGSIQRPPK